MNALKNILIGKTFSLEEISTLLTQFDQPILLIDQNYEEIIAVNSELLELTAFTSEELIDTPLASILIKKNTKNQKQPLFSLLRKTKQPVSVSADFIDLDDKQQIAIVKLKILNFKEKQKIDIDLIIKSITKIFYSFPSQSPKLFLEKAFSIIKDDFLFDQVVIFYLDEQEKFLEQISQKGKDKIFPKILPISELKRINQLDIWQPGKRVITEVHKIARINNHKMAITIPIVLNQKKRGLVVFSNTRTNFQTEDLFIVEKIVNSINHLTAINYDLNENIEKLFIFDSQLGVFRQLFSRVSTGCIFISLDGKIESANPAIQDMFNYKEFELQGMPIDSLFPRSPHSEQLVEEILNAEKELEFENVELINRSGKKIPTRLQVNKINNTNTSNILLTLEDISRLKATELRMEELNHKASLGELIADFAHEVRNPINNLSTGLQVLSNANFDQDDADVINRMQNDCVRLNHIMESVLSYSKPIETNKQELDIADLFHRVIYQWEERCQERDIKIYTNFQDGLLPIFGDAPSLDRVFNNLISNAIDAMHAKGGTLGIHAKNEENHHILISISDTGPGIPAEIFKDLFKPFVSFNPKGTGLGLAISKKIIDAHSGDIYADTFPGGTIFHIQLPVKP